MCTVTYIPKSNGFYFTSSRDEKSSRATIPPIKYSENGIDLIYPKDELAGGTWIASSLEGKTACLLNGAFVNHHKQKSYVKSRGLILLDSFKYNNVIEFSEKRDLVNVEPFTLLTLDYTSGNLDEFFEFRWDGKNKHLRQLETNAQQIWSSATLYPPLVQLARKRLFEKWFDDHKDFEDKMILGFHNRKHGLNASDDIIMKRDGDLMTLSISQIQLDNCIANFSYYDIINDKYHKVKLIKSEFANA
ncbi:MAG: NRDE family protein [Sphingobacteriaceae bacterium]|nr:NRDE family protein [Sphingobacteriaceae bacterium]MBK7819058.1 NRDE family protein [Sphingobacteriaceae bacterium]